jgi:hypothetical protein
MLHANNCGGKRGGTTAREWEEEKDERFWEEEKANGAGT